MKRTLRSWFALGLSFLAALAPARAQTTSTGRIVYYQNTFEDPNGGTSYRIFLINPDGTNQTKISRSPTESDLFPDLSPDGTKIACNGSTDGITLLNADGSNRTAIPNTAGFIVPVWSPDGKRLLARYQGSTNSIAVFNPDGTGLVNVSLRTDFPVLSDVNWSPDGTRIVFTARAEFGNRQYHLFVTKADGSATPVKLSTDDDANYSTPSWSPDGRRILVSKSGSSGFGVYFVDAVTGAETKFNDGSDGNEQAATWSPDGTQIALSSFSGSDGGSLVIVNADGTNRRVLPGGQANAPRWRGAAAGGTVTGGGGTTNGITVTIPGTSNLWLAGAAPGTTASTGQDTLANATPFRVPGVTLTAGATLSFTAASGNVSNDPANPVTVGPDGGPYLGNTFYGHDAENGLANLTAPINSLIGVFLDDRVPAAQSFVPPGTVNDDNSINYSSIRPGLRQPFYIGDGKDTNGRPQIVVVPAGATRLFLGALDPSDQENNLGSFAVTILGAGNGTGTGGPTPGGAVLAVTDTSEKSTSDGTGGTAIPGDTLTYTFTVRNTGAGTATGVSVTAILNGTKFKSATINNGVGINATVNGPQLVLPRFDLAPGASQTFTVKAKVPATFPVDGRTVGLGFAGVTADGAAPLSGLAGLNSTVLSPYQTSVSYNANVGPGDVLTFRFTTINRSTLPVSGVASVVQVPAGVNFLSVNADTGAAINVQPDGGGNLRIVLPDLAANSTVNYAVSVRIPYDTAAGATLTLPGTQLIAGGTTYAEPGATVMLNGNPAASPPKLAISKSIVDPFSLAGLFLFDPARAAKLAAAFPQVAFYTTDPATGQLVPNGPAIQAFGAALNPFIGEDDAGGHLRSVTTPSGKQPVTYVTFTLLYENTGGSNAGDFSVTDRVPDGFAYVPDAPASALPGDLLPPPYALINGVPATPATLQVTDNGRTLDFRVKAKLKPGQSGLIVYQLQVVPAAQGGVTPGTTVDTRGARISSSSLSGDVLASPDGEPLLISAPLHFSFRAFTPDNNRGDVGRAATFQFYYKNDGGKKTTDFAIRVPVPTGGTFASASVVNGPGADGVSRLPDGGALFTIGKVKPGQSGLVQARFIPTAAVLQTADKVMRVQFEVTLDGVFNPRAAHPDPVARTAASQPEPRALGDDPLHPPGVLIVYPPVSPGSPRLFIQRSAPLVVENGKPFSYNIVVGNLGDQPIARANITDVLPAGLDSAQITGNDGPIVVTRGANGRNTYSIPLINGIPAHGVRAVKIQLKASPELFATEGLVNVTDDGLYATSTAQGYPVSCPPAGTRLLRANETLALVGSDGISAGLAPYGFDASAVTTVNKAVNANSRVTTIGGADVLTTKTGALIVPLGSPALPPGQVVRGGGPVLVTGPAGVISNDGGSLISQDGGGLVASGAGNLIRLNGLISQDGGSLYGGVPQSAGSLLAGLISQDGGGLVASGGGNILRGGGLNLISQDGGGVISNDGGSLVASGAGNLVASGGGNVFATGFSNLIGQDGGSIVSHDAGGLVASGAGNFLANGGGKIVATGGGNIISDNSAGLIGSSPNTAALVASGASNLIGVSGGSVINGTGSGLVASGAGN